MEKNRILGSQDNTKIVRILEVKESSFLVIDCIKRTMPQWKEKEQFKDWKSLTEQELWEITNIYPRVLQEESIQTTQEVEIYFNFVGRFVPPAFGEVELTPEELEEIRKREERKDRLHQNYLKRKASGAQKRYEDKIKGRKKAEIEAKKAAIRAEDIAKGVFVPVSSLPQREPMKGAQIA